MITKTPNMSVSENDGDSITNNRKRTLDNKDQTEKKRFKTKSLYRQPTVRELNRLHETENLFNSNLFRLQVEEVLEEVKVKDKTIEKFKTWFEDFKNHLLSIPENHNEYDLTEQTLFKKIQVKIPVGDELKRSKCNFKFNKFSEVNIVGSYALNCAINSQLCVDVEIVIPSDTFTKNDSVNYRYHKKRAAYLAYIASFIKNYDNVEEINYSCSNSSDTKPYLILKPKGKLGNKVSLKIKLSCEREAYKYHRFSPSRNNLREAWFFNSGNSESVSDVGPPTPYYNSSVLFDITSSTNNDYLHDLLGKGDNLKQAVILLKIWLRQRNIKVSGFIVNMYVAYLAQTKRINNIMSSYQIVRNVWISLKSSEWDTKGITAYKGDEPTPSLEEFLNHFPVVFIDRTGYYNICWQMDIGTYHTLRRESSMAVELLDSPTINSFIPLFMTSFKPCVQFDHILRIKDLEKFKEAVYSKVSVEDKLNYGTDILPLVTKTVFSILSQGLGKKVDLLLPLTNTEHTWPLKQSYKKGLKNIKEDLAYGLILNPENAMEIVHKGPPANLPEAEKFREFWGEKSELRRFQDGSITETCVWQGDTLSERRMVAKQIIEYLLDLKFGINAEVFYVANQLESALIRKEIASQDGALGTGEECSVRVLHAFDELRRDLRSLTDLPLDINSVYGVSPVFSYAEPFPPQPAGLSGTNHWRRESSCLIRDNGSVIKCPIYTPVTTAIVELGHSGKWPGDLEAFRCLKAAFHVKIAENLAKQFSVPTHAHATHINVLKSGLVFRLEIAHPKEITLLRREVEGRVVRHKENDESVNLQCHSVIMPRLRGAMHGLHQKYPAYGPTTSLLKRFLSSHLLDEDHFPHTVIELLVASIFLRPEPWSAPTQPLCAFMRILHLLLSKNWNTEPLVVNFNDELNKEALMESEKKYAAKESEMPAMYIITPYDGEFDSAWTRKSPTVNVLARVQLLAKSTFNYLEENLLREAKDNVLGVFVPSLVGYDVLIHLRPHLVPYYGERVDKKPVPRTSAPVKDGLDALIPVVDFNPVSKYLDELRTAYGLFALFFHDMYGGDVIAVLWRPDVKDTKEFQISNAHALKPVNIDGETQYQINLKAIVEDFKILGDGLVKNITVN